MRKRWFCLFLAAALLLTSVPASGAETTFFVAVNDSLPLMLTGDPEPYEWNGNLYVPYTVFDARPGGIVPAYDPDGGFLTLFTMAQRMVFQLEDDYYTDENGVDVPVRLLYLHGTPLIPVNAVAEIFQIQVSLLTSQSGYPILRFTDGREVYDDELFVERAENLIQYNISQWETGGETGEGINGEPNDTPMEETPLPPMAVYLTFAGEAVCEETLDYLRSVEGHGAFS